MKLHNKIYPLTTLMIFSVLIFWGSISALGYELKLDGTLVKRVEAPVSEHGESDHTINIEETPAQDSADTSKNTVDSDSGQPQSPSAESETEKEFTTVTHDYLDGALFIGDSRTAVLYEYANWEKTHFFVEYGLSVWDVMDKKLAVDETTGAKLTVREALKENHYDKIYLMLGINELGRGTAESFCAQYQRVVDEIRALQPDAILFVQSIMHVTEKKDREGTYINNAEINARNEKLKTLADNIHIFWIDENEVFDVEGSGALNPDYTWDGVHLQAKYISIWEEFLLSHGIETSSLAIQPEP